MHHAANAYGAVAKQIANPRELEASLLLKAASRLQAIGDEWEGKNGELSDALLYNRKLWAIFLAAMAQADSPLPKEVRQNVSNLGLFVMNQTVSLLCEPRREKLGSLIRINREVAAGLLGRG
jgi:flagellar protein FlaF